MYYTHYKSKSDTQETKKYQNPGFNSFILASLVGWWRWSLKFGGETCGAEIEVGLFGDGGGRGFDFVYHVVWRGKCVGFEGDGTV